MSARSSSSVSKSELSAAKSSSSVGQLLLADLLDVDLEDRGLAGEMLGAVLLGEGHLDRCAPRLRRRRSAPPRSRRSERWSRARAGSRWPCRPRTPRRRPAGEVDRAGSRPSAAARSTGCSEAKLSRIRSISSSTAPRATSGSALPTSRPLYSPSLAVGRTPTSIVKLERLALAGQRRSMSSFGLADRASPRSRGAPARTTRAAPRASPPR